MTMTNLGSESGVPQRLVLISISMFLQSASTGIFRSEGARYLVHLVHLLYPPGHHRVRRLPLPQAKSDEEKEKGEDEAGQGTGRQGEQRGRRRPIEEEGGTKTVRRQDFRG